MFGNKMMADKMAAKKKPKGGETPQRAALAQLAGKAMGTGVAAAASGGKTPFKVIRKFRK